MLEEDIKPQRPESGEAQLNKSSCILTVLHGKEIMLAVMLVMLCFLPFVNKAFHIDDIAFIAVSKMIGWNPLHANPINYEYMGKELANLLPYETTHPFLVPYYIKVVTTFFGEREVPLHLAFLVFPLIAVFSIIQLNTALFPDGRRTIPLVALFFCTLPAFVVNGQNIMTDVPTLAFLLMAMAGFCSGAEKGDKSMTWLGAAGLVLAIFCSYQAVVFAPLLFCYLIWRRRLTILSTLCLAIPLLLLAIWLFSVYSMYDIFPILKTKMESASGSMADEIRRGLLPLNLIHKIFAIFSFIGAAMVWLIPLHYALTRKLGRFIIIFIPLLSGSYIATYRLTGYQLGTNLLLSIFVSLGVITCITMILEAKERLREEDDAKRAIFLLAWFFCVILFNIAVLPFGATRYLLPAFPPAILLITNNPSWSFTSPLRRIALAAVAGCAMIFALASAYSDYFYAGSYRDFAKEISGFRNRFPQGTKVWYVGEWGMRYYLKKADARYLLAESEEPKIGDFVVIPEMPRLWNPSIQLQKRLVFYSEKRFVSVLPLRLFNRRSHAGFYAHHWGMLPFAFYSGPDEVIKIYLVTS